MANMASACALIIPNDKSFENSRIWRTKTAASTCVLVSISVVCVLVMVVCGVLVVREYSLAAGYKRTTCRVENITYSSPVPCLYCPGHRDKSKDRGAGACLHSFFPCLRVIVSYMAYGREVDGLLHHDSLEAIGAFSQCSFHACQKDLEESKKEIEEQAEPWYAMQSAPFKCYFNSQDPEDVIAHKMYTTWDVVHCMLWPSLTIIVCCCIFLYMEAHRRRLTFCGHLEPEDSVIGRPYNHAFSESEVILLNQGGFNDLRKTRSVDCKLVNHVDADKDLPSRQLRSHASLEALRGQNYPTSSRYFDGRAKSFELLK